MRKCTKILLFLLVPVLTCAQQHLPDTIIRAAKTAANDSLRYKANHDAYLYFEEINKDSALYYNEKCLYLSQQDKKKLVTARCLASKGYLLTGKGQYAEALKNILQAFAIAEDPKNASNSWFTDNRWDTNRGHSPEQTRLFVLALIHHMYGILMRATHNTQQEIFHFAEARRIAVLIDNKPRIMLADMNLGGAYLSVNKTDSALIFLNEGKEMTLRFGPKKYLSFILMNLGDIAHKKGDAAAEKRYYYEGVASATEQKNQTTLTWLYLRLTDVYVREKQKDSSLYFAKRALQSFSTLGIFSGETLNVGTIYQRLSDSYKLRGQTDSAYKYAGLALAAKDKVNNIQIENLAQFQGLSLKEQLRLQNLEKEKALYQSRVRTYGLLAGLLVFLIAALVLYRNNRQKHKANYLLHEQKEEIEAQRDDLENKNHELEIESALERVRAVAMGMRSPDDLLNICRALFAELQLLDFSDLRNAIIHTYLNANYLIDYDYSDFKQGHISRIPYSDNPIAEKYAKDIRKTNDAFAELIITGSKLKEWKVFMDANNAVPDERLANATSLYYYIYAVGDASIGISTFSPIQADKLDVLKRFRNVFDLAYRRYMDIKQAEEQAREARIEAALEKVRSRSLAMHKSEELHEIVAVVAEKLQELGVEMEGAVILIPARDKKGLTMWSAMTAHMNVPPLYVPYGHSLINELADIWESKTGYWARTWSFEEKDEYWRWAFENSDFKKIPDSRKKQILNGTSYALSTAIEKNSGITIPSHTGQMLSDNDAGILKRFAKVFEQAYIRFLDLQKAEAQAREAQIELSLERVRASAMAMHKTDQLLDAAELLYKELTSLGINSMAITYAIMAGDEKSAAYYSINPVDGKLNPVPFDLSHTETEVMRFILAGWKKQEAVSKLVLDEEATLKHQTYIAGIVQAHFVENNFDQPFSVEAFLEISPKKAVIYAFNFAQGYIFIIGSEHLTKPQEEMVMRFTKVFEMTYRRFLDLQKAEAQAREAQIEAALERVRSRTMGMQRSDELQGAALLLFQQAEALGVNAFACGFNIWDDDWKFATGWMGSVQGLEPPFKTDSSKDVYLPIYKAAKKGEPLFVIEQGGKELEAHYGYLATIPTFRDVILKGWTDAGLSAPTFQIIHCAYFAQGYLMFISYESCPEAYDIFKRFAKVFEQTYTRFLDLQKAEAQTHEAQIEGALERVRSRSMGMQKSNELKEVIQIVYDQFVHLGIPVEHTGFIMDIRERDDMHIWLADKHEVPAEITIPYFDSPHWNSYIDAKAKGIDFFANYLDFETKNKFYRDLFELIPGVTDEARQYYLSCPGLAGSTVLLDSVGLYIENFSGTPFTDEENAILIRFGKVFQQTYTRFLDLQKAEEQAREAQIQLALERVRARTMAMQKSDEMHEVIQVIYEQLVHLGLDVASAGFIMDYTETNDLNVWVSRWGEPYSTLLHIPYFDHTVFRLYVEAKEQGLDFYTVTLNKEEKDSLYLHIFDSIPGMTDERRERVLSTSAYADSHVLTKDVVLYIQNFTGVPYSDAENDILKRFGNSFQQTYTRFSDLKKAEEQAREAQIELALEKVRAKAMAMHKTDDLFEVAELLYREVTDLGIASMATGHCLVAEDKISANRYGINPVDGRLTKTPIVYRLTESKVMSSILTSWKENKAFHVIELNEKETLENQKWVANEMLESLKKHDPNTSFTVKSFLAASPEKVVLYNFNFTEGYLFIVRDERLTPEQEDLALRFTRVFEMTYRRFLDLKKAEEQARESQIQLALERVRARTMAMQKSEELAETVYILLQQFKELGENPDQATIGIVNEEERVIEYWVTMYGNQENKVYKFSIDEPIVTGKIYNAWKKQKKSLVVDLSGKELHDFARYRESKGGAKLNKNEQRRIINIAFFSKGLINVQSTEARSEESIWLLERFAGVFEGTYTRFLDLKQAEELARESQIQLALERVRARTMAMQKSDELHEVIQLVFDQLQQLNFKIDNANFTLNYQETDDLDLWLAVAGVQYPTKIYVPYFKHPMFDRFNKAKGKGGLFTDTLSKEEKDSFFGHFFKYVPKVLSERKDLAFSHPGFARSVVFMKNTALTIINYQGIPFSEAENNTLLRFGQAFDQTYTRFKDLEQAEAQTREAQIQLGLERVRAKAMAMQTSEELNELIGTVFGELTKLDFVLTRCLIMIFDLETKASRWWMANSEAPAEPMNYLVQNHKNPAYDAYLKAWKERDLKWNYALKGKVKRDWDDFLFVDTELAQLPGPVIEGMKAPEQVLLSASFNNFGCLTLVTLEPLSDEHSDIMLRFAKVFDMCYTRFNDLKQAEEQAREGQIQLGLERVRARAMAMQSSDELAELVDIVFKELNRFDFGLTHCALAIADADSTGITLWQANAEPDQPPISFYRKSIDHPYPNAAYKEWKKRTPKWVYHLEGAEKSAMHDYYERSKDTMNVPHAVKAGMASYDSIILSHSFNNFGYLRADTVNPLSDKNLDIVYRFARVFDLCYTRFTDIKQAEAQARESQIQLALERVRSKTMAMHNSADVGETVTLMFNELVKLGVEKIARCGIAIPDNNKVMELWTARLNQGEKEDIAIGHIDMAIHPMLGLVFDAWKSKQATFEYILEGDDMTRYITAINNSSRYPIKYDPGAWGTKQYHNDFFFQEGMVFAFTSQPLSAEISSIFKRFSGVFGQTYRRYLDLQKAEAAAREAQIEAALERVRGKAMAMRSSGDLNDTANTVFIELRKLGVDLVRCGLGLMEKETHISTIHAATNSDEGGSLEVLGNIDMNIHPVFAGIYSHWRKNEDYFPVLEGESLKAYYEKLHESGISVPEWKSSEKQYGYFLQFAYGSLYAWSGKQESELTIKTLKRFTSVISLTYTRYIELQKAESNTKEAIKQASLDRVRAEIASMRKRNDLERITPLIWNELTILGIPFIRCGVFIMDEEEKLIHTFLSTPDGKAIGAFHIPFDTSGNFEIMVNCWRNKVPYIDHWKEEAFSQFADTLVKQGAIASKAQYMRTLPHEGIHLNFLPFLQGMLYVGNSSPLAEDDISLVQAVADAFSTAYARYEDFNKLEAAKQQVDNTLADLKATQTKLIQSEKMASLGELTAGIAHEIQNPLNFVNNFSEVNQEMIDELAEELKAGNIEEALAIAADIKDNEEKINHHGKRADGIVKGMLQHSRTGGGEKQPTNINTLADEFMRLSYHGLRAKDKVFNAELVMHFDEKLPKINVIPQDIGRVLLNLFNNAFYAVNQKKKVLNDNYKPEVTVTTMAGNDRVIIKVKDNGVGMPDGIKDKIMQPFFTTKPTGEGTGLGLSLTYDMVVKGHGGSIQVDSTEGRGSEFIIQLPIN